MLLGCLCDANGIYLPVGVNPDPPLKPINLTEPFENVAQFRIADFLFCKVEMSQGGINELMELWMLTMLKHGDFGPFKNHDSMHKAIGSIRQGDAPWKCFVAQADMNFSLNTLNWQRDQYQIWYRDPDTIISNMFANPDFSDEFDAAPLMSLQALYAQNSQIYPFITQYLQNSVRLANSLVRESRVCVCKIFCICKEGYHPL